MIDVIPQLSGRLAECCESSAREEGYSHERGLGRRVQSIQQTVVRMTYHCISLAAHLGRR